MGDPQSKLVSKTSHIIKLWVWLKKKFALNTGESSWTALTEDLSSIPSTYLEAQLSVTPIPGIKCPLLSSVGTSQAWGTTCIHSGKTFTPTHKFTEKKKKKFFKNCHSEYSEQRWFPTSGLQSMHTYAATLRQKLYISHVQHDGLTGPPLQTWNQQILLPPSLPHPC